MNARKNPNPKRKNRALSGSLPGINPRNQEIEKRSTTPALLETVCGAPERTKPRYIPHNA